VRANILQLFLDTDSLFVTDTMMRKIHPKLTANTVPLYIAMH